ncbi:O-methyltransferase [Sporolituus thermophilus]|uniref:tRNA 5-hydroxyuridine methyltransferase n=1 Tax=Sporolituus thermophilus DSM 23256 TaxID=1123285 RepID=A0A1G7IDB2_9FIRM|nr:O-methyltransferase [Sporolituus thermophilus]SDF10496.1 Predicted O-methyltransferase YrrM [Sporolituus thermophilus DSM 23256]
MEYYTALLRELEDYAACCGIPIIGRAGAELLCQVAVERQPKQILEVGTAIGYSTLLLLAAVPEARIVTIEINRQRWEKAREMIIRAGAAERATLLLGDAGMLLSNLDGPFDFVFLDAAKGQYLDYLLKLLDKLSDGAVIVADNVLFRGWVHSEGFVPRRYRTLVKRLREFLAFITADPRFTTTVCDIGDGVAICTFRRGIR